MYPNPANSIKLPPNRQRLLDDVIALYSMQPTIERVSRGMVPDMPREEMTWSGKIALSLTIVGICRCSSKLRFR